MQCQFDFGGKVAMVNGASTGIGQATALAFGRSGATVALVDINAEDGQAVAEQIIRNGGSATFHQADLTNPAQVDRVFGEIETQYGRIDCAHNNVGYAWGGDIIDMSVDDWDRTLNLCLKSPFLCMQHELRMMRANGGGAIVNTASMAGVRCSLVANGAYAAAKAGLIQLTGYVALAHAKDNIRVNSVSPALTRTPIVEHYLDEEQQKEVVERDQPIARIIEPEEIAANVLWLCSDGAAMITGENICVAGGSQV